MTVWRSWDEDDEEYAERSIVRDLVPAALEPFLDSWMKDRLRRDSYWIDSSTVYWVQSSLHERFDVDSEHNGDVAVEDFMEQVEARGQRFKLRVLDLMLGDIEVHPINPDPSMVDELRWHLDATASALTVVRLGSNFRLSRRLTDGIEDLADEVVRSASQRAGQYLSSGWTAAYGLEPDTSKVMTESIRAVEAAAGPRVLPVDKRATLGKIVASLKSRTDWRLVLDRRDDGHPDHRAVLLGMLETLAFAQRDRHAGAPPSVLQAQGHVQLAATLVNWFSTGVIEFDCGRDSSRDKG